MSSDDAERPDRLARVSATYDLTAQWHLDWRPGFALPARFSAIIEGDWLAYRVLLDLAVHDHQVESVALTLESREDGERVSARGLREVPLGECIRLATSAALRPMKRKRGELTIQFGGPSEVELPSRAAQPRRVPDAWIEEAADIYLRASENPTQAVQDEHSQGPISYTTAARWVGEARKRELLPPTTPGRATPAADDQED